MIGIIIQARTGSTRFPRKIYEDLNGKYTLQRVLEGAKQSTLAHKIILAMPTYDQSEFEERREKGELKAFTDHRFAVYFGSSDDLVDRYFQSARRYGLDLVVRITADCPLTQGQLIDEMLLEYQKNGCNGFMGNNQLVSPSFYPDGVDVEIFPYWMLAETWINAKDPYEREHCTPYMYSKNKPYNIYGFLNKRPNSMLTNKHSDFSFDTEEDRQLIWKICEKYDVLQDSSNVARLNKALLGV